MAAAAACSAFRLIALAAIASYGAVALSYAPSTTVSRSALARPAPLSLAARTGRPVICQLPVPDSSRELPERPEGEADAPERRELESRLLTDIERFKESRAATDRTVGNDEDEEGTLQKTINLLGTILTYNFFVICAFFLWFLTGVGAQYGAGNEAIIQSFRGSWDLLIQPLLGTHMLLTFISAGLERLAKQGS